MSTQESTFWSREFSDAELDLEADAGDFLFAAQLLINPETTMSLDEQEALRRHMVEGQWPQGWESWGGWQRPLH